MRILSASTGVDEALRIIAEGGVVAHATETCYGLACDISNPDAVQRVFTIKDRPTTQPISVLFGSIHQAEKYAVWNDKAHELAKMYLPGPLTIILPIHDDAPKRPFPTPDGGDTIGVRVSSHSLAHQLAMYSSVLLSTTSANVSGFENPYSVDDIVEQFEDREHRPDLVLDSGPLPKVPPSTVLNLASSEPTVLRQGEKKV